MSIEGRSGTDAASMLAVLTLQRNAFLAEGVVTAAVRRDRLQRAIDLLVDRGDALCDAMSADFGYRPRTMSRLTDIASSIKALKYARGNLDAWMNSETRDLSDPYPRLAAEGRVDFQPKGVVGNISPWNFPVNLTFSPLSAMLAAGNRVMIKPSEYTPETSRLMAELVADYFDESEISVFPGGPEVGRIFAGLPFDHLLFTGATEVGRHILRAAAENLVPVTLELGGKSPVIVGRSADLDQTADRIVLGKMLNAGQICLAPDYILAPRENETLLVEALIRRASAAYPDMAGNGDYGAVINDRHRARLDAHVADAKAKGAEVIEVNPAEETLSGDQIKRPLTLLRGAHDQMTAMREEIFGPVLPILAYDTIEEAVAYVNGRPRPLGLYYFGTDRAEEDLVVTRTTSGGVTVNDVLQHVAHEELPFGGVGPSGMGAYHGLDGFKTFSHAKTVYRQTLADLAGMAGSRPPYGEGLNSVLSATITK